MDSDADTAASVSEDESVRAPPSQPPPRHRRGRRAAAAMPLTSEEEEPSSASSTPSSSSSSSHSPPSRPSSGQLPPPSTPAVSELGKSSVQANAALMGMFASMAAEHEGQHPFRRRTAVLHELTSFDCLCGLYAAVVCLVGYGYLRVVHMLVEGLLLLLLVALVVALNMWRSYLEHSELVRLLRARMKLVLELPTLAQTQTTDHPPSSTFVRTCRDGRWRPLPANLLVEGDLIEVDADDPIPGTCKAVSLDHFDLSSHPSPPSTSPPLPHVDPSPLPPLHPVVSTSTVALHSHHVVHPSLSASPFHSFSHPSHPAPHLHGSYGHLPHTTSAHSFSHPGTAPHRVSYPRVISPQAGPPAGPGRPGEPGRGLEVGRGLVASVSDSALSAMSAEAEEEELKLDVGDVAGPLTAGLSRPLQQSRGVQSMSSIASYASTAPPASAASPEAAVPSLASLAASSALYYLVVEPPLKQQLTFLLRPPRLSRDDRPPPPLAVARTRLIMRRVRYLLCSCFVLYIVISIIRLSSLHGWPSSAASDSSSSERRNWYVDLFYSSALLVLPLCLLPAPLYIFVLDAVGNAHLLVVQEAVQARTEQGYGPSSLLGADGEEMRERERRERERVKMGGRRHRSDSVSSLSSASSDDGDGEDADIDDHLTFTFIDSLQLSLSSTLQHSLDIASGREVWITRTVNPLLTLGTITVFCCLDSEGILSENEPSPDHLLLFQQEKPVIVDIINDPTSPNGMMMEGEWRRHMAALKPIGLSCALNHPCNFRDSQLNEFAWGGGEGGEEREITGCLCPLAREIGFDVRWLRQHFFISKVLYNVTIPQHRSARSTVKTKRKGRAGAKSIKPPSASSHPSSALSSSSSEPRIRTMTSICVQDRLLPDSFHLLSNGDPQLTFSSCYGYWDGDGIKAIDTAIESSFQSIIQQWQHQDLLCIAFAYTPIPSVYYGLLLEEGREREYLISSWEEARGWENRRPTPFADRVEEKEYIPDPSRSPLHSRKAAQLEDGEDDGHGLGAGDVSGVGEERKVSVDVEAESVLDDNEEVLLDEATDLVEDEGSPRKVRWEKPGGHADASSSDRESEAEPSVSTVDSTSTAPPLPPATASPAHSQASATSSGAAPASPHRSPTAAPPAMETDTVGGRDREELLHPPGAPPAPGPPGPPPPFSSQGSGSDVRLSLSMHTAPSPATDERQSSAASLNAPLLSQASSSTQRRLHLHPTSASTSSAPIPFHAPPRSSTPSHSHSVSTSLLLASPTGTYRSSSSSAHLPPRPVSTPALLHPHLHSTPAPALLASNQLQPLLISASSSSSFDPHESRSAHLRSPLVKGAGRSRASSLSHSQSSNLLGAMGSVTSFLPTHSHADSTVLPFAMSTPPVPTPRSASPPPIMNPHNTPLTSQPTASSALNDPPPVQADGAPFLPTSSSSVLKALQHDQLFLGMVAMRDQPKTEVRSLVEHLMAAGIRFVFFSPENERKTQAFGGKIGLQQDFNTYISLADVQDAGVQRARQGKSQLPCGVSGIRSHIAAVDNVPLLVSLFTDCTPASAKEMIRIYQENGESVMCMGSSLKVENSEAFMQADISVSLDPVPSRECKDKTFHPPSTAARRTDWSFGLGGGGSGDGSSTAVDVEEEESDYSDSREFAVSSAITSMPCALPLSSTTDVMQFVALICEGRRLSTNVNQALVFALSSFVALFLLLLLTFIVDTPPLFTGYQLLWLIVVIIPLLSFSLFYSPRSPDVMLRLSDKNIDIAADSGRHVLYFLVRFLPFVLIYAVFFLVFLHSSYDSSTLFSTFYWQSAYSGGALGDEHHFGHVLVAVQTYSLCIYVLALIVHSVSFVHRYESLHRLNPLKNRVWLWMALLCFVLQLLFAMVSVLSVGRVGVDVHWMWYLWFVWPFWIVGVDELIKMHDRERREFYHNRARSHFDTVLGMWSPK